MPKSCSRGRAATLGAVGLAALLVGGGSLRAEVVVLAGSSVSLMTLSSIDQACHWEGPVAVNVIEAPQGGFIEVMQTKAYPNFNALNTRARCNTLKLPATQVVYQSAGNFLGLDHVTVEAIFPGGDVKRIRMALSVRPQPLDGQPGPGGSQAGGAAPPLALVPVLPPRVPPVPRRAAAAPPHRHECRAAACLAARRPVPRAPEPKPLLQNI